MPPARPFVSAEDGTLDRAQLYAEVRPLARLVGLVAAVALVPFVLSILLVSVRPLALLFELIGQFVLAVGSGLVLIYAVARGIDLSGRTIE